MHTESSRRAFLRAAGGGFVAGGACAAPVATRNPAAAPRPNILILFSDDQRFDTIHALGNREVKTPHLDRLARNGTAFTRAGIMGGTMGAVCVPSRAMLLTGQTLYHAHANIIDPKKSPERARRPYHLFPEYLRQQGYQTIGIGKWHQPPELYARCFTAGENIFFGGMSDHDKVPVADFDPAGRYPKDKRRAGAKFSSELFSDSAIRFLKEAKGDKPFCLYVAFTAPHDPRMAPKQYADMYPPAKIQLPKNFLPQHPFDNGELKVRDEQLAPWPRTPEVVRQHIAAYYAMISHLDAQIGRVLDTLEATGQAGNTITVFLGDNGLAVGRHGLFGKQNVYEHSVRVPLIISGPGVPKNRRSDAMAYNFDLFPTLCDLTGLETPATVEGKSLVPILRGKAKSVRDSMFFGYRDFQRAVRTDRWKLIRYNVNGKQTTQLFNLANDPWETRNLAGESSEAGRVRALTALMKQWMEKTDDVATGFLEER